jgi:hypothetical protein
MQNKSLPLRLPPEEAEELRRRARLEGTSMNELVRSALREHFERRPVPRDKLLSEIRRIATRDADVLEALKEL